MSFRKKKTMFGVLSYIFFTMGCAFILSSMAEAEEISSVKTTGFFMPDTLRLEAFDDPDIKGVSCYLTRYDRWSPFTEDSSATSLSCRQVGPIKGKLSSKKDVFSQRLNIYFKTKRVARYWDPKRKSLIYLAYTRKFDGKNKDHSVSVVVIPPEYFKPKEK